MLEKSIGFCPQSTFFLIFFRFFSKSCAFSVLHQQLSRKRKRPATGCFRQESDTPDYSTTSSKSSASNVLRTEGDQIKFIIPELTTDPMAESLKKMARPLLPVLMTI